MELVELTLSLPGQDLSLKREAELNEAIAVVESVSLSLVPERGRSRFF